MKYLILSLSLNFLFASSVLANNDPSGTEKQLSDSELAPLQGWLTSSKQSLQAALENARTLPADEAIETLRNTVSELTRAESKPYAETLMRGALLRALDVDGLLDRGAYRDDSGQSEIRRRSLEKFLSLSSQSLSLDLNSGLAPLPYTDFGFQLADIVVEVAKAETEPNVRAALSLYALQLLQVEMARDLPHVQENARFIAMIRNAVNRDAMAHKGSTTQDSNQLLSIYEQVVKNYRNRVSSQSPLALHLKEEVELMNKPTFESSLRTIQDAETIAGLKNKWFWELARDEAARLTTEQVLKILSRLQDTQGSSVSWDRLPIQVNIVTAVYQARATTSLSLPSFLSLTDQISGCKERIQLNTDYYTRFGGYLNANEVALLVNHSGGECGEALKLRNEISESWSERIKKPSWTPVTGDEFDEFIRKAFQSHYDYSPEIKKALFDYYRNEEARLSLKQISTLIYYYSMNSRDTSIDLVMIQHFLKGKTVATFGPTDAIPFAKDLSEPSLRTRFICSYYHDIGPKEFTSAQAQYLVDQTFIMNGRFTDKILSKCLKKSPTRNKS